MATNPPVPGVPHFPTKQATAPKQRVNMLNIRVAPLKRLQAQVKPVKLDKPAFKGIV